MATDHEFCILCGRTGRELVEGVCSDCAADRATLLSPPGRGVVVLCPTCGARKLGSHWEREDTSTVLTHEDLNPLLTVHPEAAIRSIQWEETQVSALLHEFRGTARVRFRGAERTVEVPLTVKVEHRTCPECSRKSGHYYTAVLQIRGELDGPREKPPQLRDRLEQQWTTLMRDARPDWRKAVSWREALPEGWDLYVVDTLAARSMARLAKQRYGAKIKESATLVGRKDGNDLYRVTFCLRLPREPTSSRA